MPKMVHRQRNLHADRIANCGHILFEHRNAFVGDLHCHERMLQLVFLPLRQVGRFSHRAWRVRNHFYAEIHFEPGETHSFLALFHPLRVNFGIF